MEGQRSLIKGLAMRREKLKELAYHTLSPEERQSLNIHQAWILDKNAAQVQHRLEARGCHIPKYLEVYEDSGPLNNSQSIYSFIGNGELAEYAYQLGFHYSDDEFLDLICALAYDMSREDYEAYKYARINCSYFCWMVGQGMDVSSNIPTAQAMGLETELTAAHYFMANLGTVTVIWGWALDSPLSLAASEIAFSEVIVDKCHCWCSPGGCTPFVKLLEGIYWADDPLNFPGRDLFIRLILPTKKMLIGLCAARLGVLGELSWIYNTIIRYYTFTTLGLRHACCCIIEESLGPLPEEEFLELQEEESILLELFQSLIMEFEDERRHDTKLEDFFEWMRVVWAPRMREVEKDLASQRLTNQQLRDAELIGVVWESYGPKPAVEDVQEEKEGGDLWDAMNELDAIATDPERPMMKQ
ncbi:hypothetical protein IL306_001168 [Fusarium sp. DS 682]|nr:hypothetical protein IL306_001168 [Fusarium sp. DS 682]